jgi:hypothetical protein
VIAPYLDCYAAYLHQIFSSFPGTKKPGVPGKEKAPAKASALSN